MRIIVASAFAITLTIFACSSSDGTAESTGASTPGGNCKPIPCPPSTEMDPITCTCRSPDAGAASDSSDGG